MATKYNYAIVAWIADPATPQQSKGDLLGEWSDGNLAIGLSRVYHDLAADARRLDEDAIILEVRRVPITDAVGNPI
jgi:hypothetical protein